MSEHRSAHKEIAWWKVFGIFLAMGFVFFGNALGGDFVYDDLWVINQNPTVLSVSAIPKQFILPYHYLQPETGLYRPLTLVSFTFNFIFGKGPFSFHVVNTILHAANSALVFFLLVRLFGSRRVAGLSAVLFFFLPIHVEAVASIVGRADLLAFGFSLGSLLLTLERRYISASVLLFCALASKESAIGITPVIAFLLWRESAPRWREAVRKGLAFVSSGVMYLALRAIALGRNFLANDADGIYNPLKSVSPGVRLWSALKILALYVWKTWVPLHLSADYSYNQVTAVHSLLNGPALAGGIVIAVLVALLCLPRTRGSFMGFAAVFFLATFFVVSNFIFPIGTIMAERAFYMPSLALCIAAAAALDHLMSWRYRRVWFFLAGTLCLAYGIRIIDRNVVWHSREALFQDMLVTAPQSVHAKTNLAVLYLQTGQWDKARPLLGASYEAAPEHLPTLDSLGILAEHDRQYAAAEQWYLKALAIEPHYINALSNLGRMYFQLKRYDRSAQVAWQEFRYDPQPKFLVVYAMSESKQGNPDEAIRAITQSYGASPQDVQLQFALGYAYFKKGDLATANGYFRASKNPALSDEEFYTTIENF